MHYRVMFSEAGMRHNIYANSHREYHIHLLHQKADEREKNEVIGGRN